MMVLVVFIVKVGQLSAIIFSPVGVYKRQMCAYEFFSVIDAKSLLKWRTVQHLGTLTECTMMTAYFNLHMLLNLFGFIKKKYALSAFSFCFFRL